MTTREPGYYWIQDANYPYKDGRCGWDIYYWDDDCGQWEGHGATIRYSDAQFATIGPRIPEPPQIRVDLETASEAEMEAESKRLTDEASPTFDLYYDAIESIRRAIERRRARD